jgi:hypothetical protein
MDPIEPEPHTPHSRTGIRWLDASLALSAFAISLISLIVAIHHGRTMQDMAEANARMVAASSWPFLQYGTGNLNEQGLPEISLSLSNEGVGPARIERLELRYHDKPMPSTSELLAACCFQQEGDAESVLGRNNADLASGIVTSPANGKILGARQELTLLRLRRTSANMAVWDRLNKERFQIQPRVCFCSVFDECWITERKYAKPTRVAECPADWVPYGE